ncbi:hypothetical protein [Agrobacterium pusense]|uniref:hypothetical protein n=1 Tax=Agrobacterium pusense TaxID=648995 RepID=UPI000891FA66|nr:hypothetical protein [Agrobacterium pusense]OOO22690.1 hypothetical protein BTE56_04585 [Agrobacterium pusense]WKD45042.1 hypothetical protein M8C82_16700 [Agrobacterium pusense]SDE62347.1 hypothetical protein SAMN05421750_102571 [Agrobacterium pusense]
MANTTWYGDGTATVAVGSRTVTGTDTGWLTVVAGLTPIKVGDKFGIHVGRPIVIEQIISDTELLLADDWPGPAQTDAPYKVELTSPTIAAVEAMRRLLASLSNGNLDSLADLTIGVDDVPIGIGPGVFGTVKKSDIGGGVGSSGYISPGANLANNATDPTNDLDFPTCVVASSAASPIMMSHAAGTAQLDVAYGTGNGGRFDATISDGYWHCFVISDGTQVSRGLSKSLNPTSQPNYPAGFNHYRRIGSWLRRSAALYPMIQNEDDFFFVTPILERQSQAQQTDTLLAINCPIGIRTRPKLNSYQSQNAAGNIQTQISTPGTDLISFVYTSLAGERDGSFINGEVMTDTSARIRYAAMIYSGTLTNNSLSLYGFIDTRGRA